ncbi:hypothetical protein K491DRAFT_396733 [Lophiostoma macrostomum CBS 122681]|uniref:Uncharacterized protein n=1 Tax=Lophiostoma macrostomum CBS 122681 TaxID=1314788 RepID=A0A6A6T8C4_9PLEO|nr:hypothetical protein K491DRAFT_396733 [Lophiostoma macrostomum CBS 122681]
MASIISSLLVAREGPWMGKWKVALGVLSDVGNGRSRSADSLPVSILLSPRRAVTPSRLSASARPYI